MYIDFTTLSLCKAGCRYTQFTFYLFFFSAEVWTFVASSVVILGDCYLLSTNDEYQAWLTTGDGTRKLTRQSPVGPVSQEQGYNVWVDRRKRRQTVEGFGAAITNSAAYVIYNSPDRTNIMRDLFGNGEYELGRPRSFQYKSLSYI